MSSSLFFVHLYVLFLISDTFPSMLFFFVCFRFQRFFGRMYMELFRPFLASSSLLLLHIYLIFPYVVEKNRRAREQVVHDRVELQRCLNELEGMECEEIRRRKQVEYI